MAIDSREMNRRLIRLSEDRDVGFWAVDHEALPEPKRVFRAIWELEAQVNNGGFDQYFFNSSASTVPYVVAALHSVGAPATAAIVDDAIAAVGRDLPWVDDWTRRRDLAALPAVVSQQLEALTERFLRYQEDLTALLYLYVTQHRGEIGAPADF